MPQWIHDRADHIRAKNPGMPKSESFAIATQQAHATGKAPAGYGTAAGKKKAKQKYDRPAREYEKMAQLNSLYSMSKTSAVRLAMLNGLSNELGKIAAAVVPQRMTPAKLTAGKTIPTAMTMPTMPTLTPMTTTSRPAMSPTGSPSPAPAPAVGSK